MTRCLLILALTAAACSPSAGAPADGDGDGLTVVATAFPLAWIAAEVAPSAAVTSLTARGQDPHDMELTPQQRGALEQADLVVYLGDVGFQPQVEAAVAQTDGEVVPAVDVVGQAALRTLGDDHDDHVDHDDEQTEAVDPHLWFDARLMAQVATAVGQAAARADPQHADDHRRRAEQVAADLESLADEIDQALADCRHEGIVVSHEAFAYLTAPRGLEQWGISGAAAHSEASPADIARLADLVRDRDLPAVLSEPVEGRTDAEAVAGAAGVDVLEILSLDVVDEEQAERGFPELLRAQVEAVAQAAECGP